MRKKTNSVAKQQAAPKRQSARERNFMQPPVEAAYFQQPAHLRKREDRYEVGRALRVKCPRELHAEFTLDSSSRPDPVQLLIESSKGRLEKLLPIRYGRMLASPFAFFRGAAAIMAADLSDTPNTGYLVQACGDCHLLNFGAFATPERNIIFDINDFDETFPAPWEWDLKRLATSFVLCARNNGHKASDCKAAAMKVVECYRDRLRELAEMPALQAWYSYLDYEELIELTSDEALKRKRKKVLAKAISKDSLQEFVKLAHVVDQKPRIKDNPPLIFHSNEQDEPEFADRIQHGLVNYRESLPLERRVLFDRYELVDSAIKVVGVGSVGTHCAIALFFAAENDPLFLQIKEARPSVLEAYLDFEPFQSHGERVVFGQRLMQAASDVFLGHVIGDRGKHFYIRQLHDVKIRPMVEIFTPENMLGYARNCGWALARAHARSGDAAIISGYIGKGSALPLAIGKFAVAYANQNQADYEKLIDAIRDGVIEAYSE